MGEAQAYERDPYLCELDTEVIEAGVEDGRPFAVLADTVCFPEGGGQPADRGWIGEIAVLDVHKVAGAIRHYLAAPPPRGPARLRLDWGRRFDHMQQHTGQHLLTAVAQDRFGWATTAFHLGEEVSDVELEAAGLERRQLDELERAVNAEIRAARPVSARRVSAVEYASLAVRSRGLPAGHSGDIRLVEIAGLDRNTCGGTHVRSTAEIGCLKLLGSEPMRGGTRVFFVAGDRLLHRLAEHEQRNAALRALLGAPDSELVAVARAKLDDLKALDKRSRGLVEELAAATAAALAAKAGAVVEAHFEHRDLPFLQLTARALVTAAPATVAFLTAGAGGDASFVLAGGDQVAVDIQGLGRQAATSLGGRGGGSGRVFQGKCPSLERRADALALARAAVGQP